MEGAWGLEFLVRSRDPAAGGGTGIASRPCCARPTDKKAPFGAFFNVAEREGLAHILRAAVRLAYPTLRLPPRATQLARSSPPTKKPLTGLLCFGGEGGIRTLDTAKPCAGFRVRCNRPLYHLSVIGRNEAAIIAVRRTLGRCMRNASAGCISVSVSPMEGFNY